MISIRELSYVLPDGRLLLEGLNESFGNERAALVGRNGVGKTVLAKIMAGLLPPSSGEVVRGGTVFYLDQMTDPGKFEALGIRTIFDLAKASGGETMDDWEREERFSLELQRAGLGYLPPDTLTATLSGGECTRVSLVGAFLSGADFLILDEPTNHLDVPSKEALMGYLKTWKRDLLIVSHDRTLLEQMERIVELSTQGLKSYGGNYSFYAELKEGERRAAGARLEYAKTERRRTAAEQRDAMERQAHRSAQGKKSKSSAGMPKALLHAMRGNAEKTTGKLRERQREKTISLAAAEKDAFLQAEIQDPIVLIPPACSVHRGQMVLRIESLVLPYGAYRDPVDWIVTGPERAAVVGANGSGKTTLLRVLKGEIAPISGTCEVKVPYAFLDQFAAIDEKRSSMELLRGGDKTLPPEDAGTRLAQVGIARQRLWLPAGELSGGERMKVALLCAIHRAPSPQLLILDEPTNHLDLASVESVEKLLNAYTGALIVVSHDGHFLARVGVTRKIPLDATRPIDTKSHGGVFK
ncbi:MAG: ATP-binding cassette domain-containing protein [Synergistaceae bacterium]|jgi:ATPase subunit of ABC transporter with duplicated ATPase domains|nr:ATP-binding cassette domain-containing protein [Synergistaceae bacterium]